MDDFFRQNLALLTGTETKIAEAIRLEPDASKPELMRLCGITHRQSFYRAWKSLEAKVGSEMFTTLSTKPNQRVNKTEPVVTNPNHDGNKTEPGVPGDGNKTELMVTNPNQDDVSVDFYSALARADAMDSSGDERRAESPFQIRRKQQLTLLQEAWAGTFQQQIARNAAKELLQIADSQALDVYDAMQTAAERNPERPFSYVRAILKKGQTKPKQEREQEGGVIYRPVTEEMRRSWDQAEAEVMASGVLDGWSL
jgi:hypothetical protein